MNAAALFLFSITLAGVGVYGRRASTTYRPQVGLLCRVVDERACAFVFIPCEHSTARRDDVCVMDNPFAVDVCVWGPKWPDSKHMMVDNMI